jgi:hypothetical protein
LIGFLPAARVTDTATCVGPPDVIVMGSPTVLIGGLMAARIGDPTAHGGVITVGEPTVMIGEAGGGGAGGAAGAGGAGGVGGVLAGAAVAGVLYKAGRPKAALHAWRSSRETVILQALKDQRKMLEKKKNDLETWDEHTKAQVKKWFGKNDEATRKKLLDRTNKELDLNKKMSIKNFHPANPPSPGTYAYVNPSDKTHKIYLDSAFDSAPATGEDSKAGTLAHEMSHFNDIGGTEDHAYGKKGAKALAKKNPTAAMDNADNYEYFVEDAH